MSRRCQPVSYRLWTDTVELDEVDRGRSLTPTGMLASQWGGVSGRWENEALERMPRKLCKRAQNA
jgi:hypothetical protein